MTTPLSDETKAMLALAGASGSWIQRMNAQGGVYQLSYRGEYTELPDGATDHTWRAKLAHLMDLHKGKSFACLEGAILTSVTATSDQIMFETSDGRQYRQSHRQDCCESVSVEEVIGNWGDVIGTPILRAEEVSQRDDKAESGTWTFYKLDTVMGSVTVRWYGSSNGYYSESVDFERTL